jgi:hypothetical protein
MALAMMSFPFMKVCHVVENIIQNCRINLENEGHVCMKHFVQSY